MPDLWEQRDIWTMGECIPSKLTTAYLESVFLTHAAIYWRREVKRAICHNPNFAQSPSFFALPFPSSTQPWRAYATVQMKYTATSQSHYTDKTPESKFEEIAELAARRQRRSMASRAWR